MAYTIIRGKAISGADTYILYKKQGSSYEEKARSSRLLFDLLALDALDGDYVVKAIGTGYQDSEYSNLVSYTKPATEELPDTPIVPDTPVTPDPDTPDTPTEGTCVITFNIQGHGEQPDSKTIKTPGTLSDLPVLEAEGYTFGGWWLDPACSELQVTERTQVEVGTTRSILYAKWTKVVVPEVTVPEDMRGVWQFKDTLTDSFLPLTFNGQTAAVASEDINFSINSCVVGSKIIKTAVDFQAGDGSAASGNISYEVFGLPAAYTFNKSEGTQGWCGTEGTGKTIEILDNNISEEFKKQICTNAEKIADSTNSTIISFSILDNTAKAIVGATWYNYIKTIADIGSGTLKGTYQLYCESENAPVEYYNEDSGTSGFICSADNPSRVLLGSDLLVAEASYQIYDPSTLDLSTAVEKEAYHFKNILDDDFCAPGSALQVLLTVKGKLYNGFRRDSETGDLLTIENAVMANPEITLYNFNTKTWTLSDEGTKLKRFIFYAEPSSVSDDIKLKLLKNAAKC
jgi:hypothetical protein